MLNETLFKHLEDHANEDKLPILDKQTFYRYTDEFGRDVFRWTLAEYIAKVRPEFPLNEISYDEMKDNIIKLSKFDTSKICRPKEQSGEIVGEKYDDYEYSYSKYGLGIIDAPSLYNI